MSDTPISTVSSISPSLSTEHDVQALMLAQIDKLSQRHVTVSYTVVAALVVVVGLAGVGGWLGLRSYERQVLRAEAIETKYQDAQKAFSEQLAANNAERAQDAKASAALLVQIANRAVAPPPPVVQAGLAVSAPAEGVSDALQSVYPTLGAIKVIPTSPGASSASPQLAVTIPQGQLFIQTKLDLNKATGDLADTSELLSLANRDKSTLSKDLDQCTDLNLKANDTISAYKKVAVKSKWRKILDGIEKVGLVLGGAALGRAL